MLELWEEGAHSSEVLESSKATGSGKLQTLGGMGLPGCVKAQELQEVTLLKKKARGVLGLRGVTAQGVLWQHTRVLS